MDKKEIRELIKGRKAGMSQERRAREENAALSALEADAAFQSARTVLVYCSLPDEFSTAEFLKRWSGVPGTAVPAGKKRLVVPLVDGTELKLKEYCPGKLVQGFKGILEPSSDLPDISSSEIDYAIIPGVAFTLDGKRLGRGKGFYDRLLPQLRCPTAGLAWSCQIEADLPSDPWDVKLTKVFFSR